MKFIITFFIIITSSLTMAKNPDVSFGGWGETGIKAEQQNIADGYPVVTYYAAKMQADIELDEHIEIQIDVKGDSSDNQLDFNEFSIKFEYTDYFRVKAGNLKQPFGEEQQTSHDKILTFNRSNAHLAMAKMGYANRSFAVKGYYNYNDKRPNFPYSYAVSLFKDNSNNSGVNLMFSRHFSTVKLSAYGQTIYKKGRGELNIVTFAAGTDAVYEVDNFSASAGFFILQDPVVGFQNMEQNLLNQSSNLDESIIAATMQTQMAYQFDTQSEIIQSYEPLFLTSLYLPTLEDTQNLELQTAFGLNAYFSKDVRLRFQFDFIFTKKSTSVEPSINGSSVELGLQASY